MSFYVYKNYGSEVWKCKNLKSALVIATWRLQYFDDTVVITMWDYKNKKEVDIASTTGLMSEGDYAVFDFEDGLRKFKKHHRYFPEEEKYDFGLEFKDGVLWLSDIFRNKWAELESGLYEKEAREDIAYIKI